MLGNQLPIVYTIKVIHDHFGKVTVYQSWLINWKQFYSTLSLIHFQNRIHNIEIEPSVNYLIAVFKDIDDSVEHVGFEAHQRIYEAFERTHLNPSIWPCTLSAFLRVRGLTINDVEFFLESSSTPIPENAEARYLAGRKIFVRGMFSPCKASVVVLLRCAQFCSFLPRNPNIFEEQTRPEGVNMYTLYWHDGFWTFSFFRLLLLLFFHTEPARFVIVVRLFPHVSAWMGAMPRDPISRPATCKGSSFPVP